MVTLKLSAYFSATVNFTSLQEAVENYSKVVNLVEYNFVHNVCIVDQDGKVLAFKDFEETDEWQFP